MAHAGVVGMGADGGIAIQSQAFPKSPPFAVAAEPLYAGVRVDRSHVVSRLFNIWLAFVRWHPIGSAEKAISAY